MYRAGRSTAHEKNHAEKTKRKIKAMASAAAVIRTTTMICSYDRDMAVICELKCNYAAVADIIIYVPFKSHVWYCSTQQSRYFTIGLLKCQLASWSSNPSSVCTIAHSISSRRK